MHAEEFCLLASSMSHPCLSNRFLRVLATFVAANLVNLFNNKVPLLQTSGTKGVKREGSMLRSNMGSCIIPAENNPSTITVLKIMTAEETESNLALHNVENQPRTINHLQGTEPTVAKEMIRHACETETKVKSHIKAGIRSFLVFGCN
jgi:hypothetical protein